MHDGRLVGKELIYVPSLILGLYSRTKFRSVYAKTSLPQHQYFVQYSYKFPAVYVIAHEIVVKPSERGHILHKSEVDGPHPSAKAGPVVNFLGCAITKAPAQHTAGRDSPAVVADRPPLIVELNLYTTHPGNSTSAEPVV